MLCFSSASGQNPFADPLNNNNKPSSRTMALGSTQLQTEMTTRNLSGGERRPEADVTAISELLI
jgi:hypothetical protein